MAKKFAGFTPEQLGRIDPELEGKQADEQNAIIRANPALAARVGKMTMLAQNKINQSIGMAVGGTTAGANITRKSIEDPTSLATKAAVATPDQAAIDAGKVDPAAGQVTTPAPQAQVTTATPAAAATAAPATPAAQMQASQAAPQMQQQLSGVQAAQGQVSQDAQAQAATVDPTQASSLGLQAAQGQAQTVQAPDPRKVEQGEMIAGSTVDMARAKQEASFVAEEAKPSEQATVAGQMGELMQDFQGGKTPAWAAGAMRAATAQLAARGLGASSMAGQATIQAAMESALPIAQADAATFAKFESQNLSNRQQAAMFAAEKRAEFLGLEFNQEFQTRVANAAKISDIANQNFSAEQTIALENARMAQTMDLTNLSAKNAKIMADAATMSQMDMANLNNRQQAQMQNAQAFLNMDMQNLSNEQQTSMFKAQELANTLLSDTAAENAAKQFNATSENQTDQFFASMATQVSQFNTEQGNAMSRFNAGETNALSQFNKSLQNQREQFNAQNHLVVAQANAQWIQNTTTAANAAQNQANRDQALAANNLSMTAYNNIIQQERDVMAWAWQSAENALDRDRDIMVAKIKNEDDDKGNSLLSAAAGKFLGQLAINAAGNIWPTP